MSQTFQLSCESTVDMPFSYIDGRGIPVLFYSYSIDGVEYWDDMGRDPDAMSKFYEQLAAGKMPATSQINVFRYEEFFESMLQKGDVLHITLGTGMTPSFKNAEEAAEHLREKYPERELIVLDSLCSSSGYGMLVDSAADMRDAGASMDEIEQWVLANRNCVHHQFFSTDLTQFKRSGRVSGPAATVGTILGICPLMRLNSAGAIIAYKKVRGQKKVIAETVDTVMEHIRDGKDYHDKLFYVHSDCLELAEELKEALTERLGDVAANGPIYDIGTIIAAHSGPGTVAVFFYGDERTE